MKKITTLLLAIAIALLSLPAAAQTRFGSYYVTGNDLLAMIDSTNTPERLKGLYYVAAISDASHGVDHCAPDQVTMGQLRDLVRINLVRRADIRHHSAAAFVVITLRVAFPCAEKSGTAL